ncbi:MAG: hypothetical protein LBF56_04050 [Holosporales bacterium]|jgi:lipopolysaccharide export system protein LptA|nr:hypothetical protein [Holosporales bacterium]
MAEDAIETSSDEMSFDIETNECVLSGNAVVKYNDKTFKAMSITMNKSKSDALPQKMVATGGVYFEDRHITIRAKTCRIDDNTATFSGGITITSNEIGIITAEKLKYDVRTGKVNITSKNWTKLVLCRKQEDSINSIVKK